MLKKIHTTRFSLLFILLMVLIFAAFMLLASCDKQNEADQVHSDVKKIKETKETIAKKNIKSEPFVIVQPTPVTYQANLLRSPFESNQKLAANKNAAIDNPLVNYPATVLKFMGTLVKNNKQYAYLLAPDNKLYQVVVGDSVGDHHGKVIRILTDRLEILEQGSAPNKPATQHLIVLQLKDGNK